MPPKGSKKTEAQPKSKAAAAVKTSTKAKAEPKAKATVKKEAPAKKEADAALAVSAPAHSVVAGDSVVVVGAAVAMDGAETTKAPVLVLNKVGVASLPRSDDHAKKTVTNMKGSKKGKNRDFFATGFDDGDMTVIKHSIKEPIQLGGVKR